MGFFRITAKALYPRQSHACVVYNICPIPLSDTRLPVHASRTIRRASRLIVLVASLVALLAHTSCSRSLIRPVCLLSRQRREEKAIQEAPHHPAAVQRWTGVSGGAGGGAGLRGPENLPGIQVSLPLHPQNVLQRDGAELTFWVKAHLCLPSVSKWIHTFYWF